MKVCALLVILAACDSGNGGAVSPDAAADAAEPFTPETCNGSPLSLYGASPQPTDQPTYGPILLDTTGVTICMSLDARDNGNLAYFSATTTYETGDASSFELALFDSTDALIKMGADVTFGNSQPMTFANVDNSFERGAVYQVKLVARAKADTAMTSIKLSLLCPLE